MSRARSRERVRMVLLRLLVQHAQDGAWDKAVVTVRLLEQLAVQEEA